MPYCICAKEQRDKEAIQGSDTKFGETPSRTFTVKDQNYKPCK